ncbi:MAG: M28 family peptidase [Pyrinomonadaceae bacterium]
MVRKLVSFGTRNTLSVQNDKARGIGAARDWLFEEFSKLNRDANSRLSVELQTFEQPVAARIPQPTKITNVVATLPGTEASSAKRVYVVSGHYDSMCTSPVDAERDAPGANDDASGVAAVLEDGARDVQETVRFDNYFHGCGRRRAGPARRQILR